MGNVGKTVYVYVFDTMADWEPGYAVAELRKGNLFRKGLPPYEVKTFSIAGGDIKTMGGITIRPDLLLRDVSVREAALLLLPGGETWLEPVHSPVLEKAKEFVSSGIPVAAICGATMALGRAGMLDSVAHTSNALEPLQAAAPAYRGQSYYRNEPAVSDGNIITASGLAPLEFAFQILKTLNVCSSDILDVWYRLYATREPKYYMELMEKIQAAG